MRLFILSVNNKIGGVEYLTTVLDVIDSVWILVFLLVAAVAVLFYMYFLYRIYREDAEAEGLREKCREKCRENKYELVESEVLDFAIIQEEKPVRGIEGKESVRSIEGEGQHRLGITGIINETKFAKQVVR